MSFFRLSIAELSGVFLLAVMLVLIMTSIKYITKWKHVDRTMLMLLIMTTATFLLLSSFDAYTFSMLWRKFLVLTIIAVILNYLFNLAIESKLIEKDKQINWQEGKMMTRGALIGGAVILAGFMAFTIWFTQPKDLSQTLEGVHFQLSNLESEEEVRIEIDGELKPTIVGGAVFEGEFNIQGSETIIPEEEAEAYIDYRKSGERYETFFYYDSDVGSIGQMFVKDDFEQLVITRYNERSWSSEDGWVISAPAKGRQEALDLARKLTNLDLE